MEQFFGNIDIGQAMAQRECFNGVQTTMQRVEQNLEGKSLREQREYLERHHRDTLEKFGDLLNSWNPLNRETDAQAVTRLLNDMRSEQERRCSRIR